ncbi:hypothetical protein RHGRI_037429 [Rhododendron griersonianum]|uniref:Uncharacterized protein n=1 Tax=Rhododendron griersonianum TaxID=479676 RepID=A0AAV6HXB8_9ERIC|nr:hypothetical protein RHGRI_037429 [Rhododendron griersonianum]
MDPPPSTPHLSLSHHKSTTTGAPVPRRLLSTLVCKGYSEIMRCGCKLLLVISLSNIQNDFTRVRYMTLTRPGQIRNSKNPRCLVVEKSDYMIICGCTPEDMSCCKDSVHGIM